MDDSYIAENCLIAELLNCLIVAYHKLTFNL